MKQPIAFLFTLLLLPCAFGAELPDVIARIKPSIVAVGTFHPTRSPRAVYLGTGFVVADGRHVITNSHVVPDELDSERRETVAIFLPDQGDQAKVVAAKIVKRDARHDLCLLLIEGPALPAMQLGHSEEVREGELHALTGYPIGMVLGLHPVTHRAMVSAITPTIIPVANARSLSPKLIQSMRTPFDVFQLDAVAFPGNSGSPLYEPDSGRVVGVVNSVFVKGTKEAALSDPSGITYAIPVQFVRELLTEAKVKP